MRLKIFFFLLIYSFLFLYPLYGRENDRLFIHPDGIYRIVLPPGWQEHNEGGEYYFQINEGSYNYASCFISVFLLEEDMTLEDLVSLNEFSGYGIESEVIYRGRTVVADRDAIFVRQKMDYETTFMNVTTWSDYYYLTAEDKGLIMYFVTSGDYERFKGDFALMAGSFNTGTSAPICTDYSPSYNEDSYSYNSNQPGNHNNGQNEENYIEPSYIPGPSAEWVNRGDNLYRQKKYEKAISCYNKAIELEPHNLNGWYGKAGVLRETGNYYEALICFDKVLEIYPLHAITWNNKSYVLYETGNYPEALVCIDRALEINPLFTAAWDTKGTVLAIMGNYSEAIVCYDKALESGPENPFVWNNKGLLLYKQREYQEAVACYDKALLFDPDYEEARKNRKEALLKFSEEGFR